MANRKKTSRVSRNDNDYYQYDTTLKKGSRGIEAVHKVENEIARNVTELEELWEKWDGKIYVSFTAEKKRTWKKYHKFFVTAHEDKARERFFQIARSSLSKIAPKITEEELGRQSYLVSEYDGNIYRNEYDRENGLFVLEYFFLDTLYRDEYKLVPTKNGWELHLFKWMKFPLPIREFSMVAEQAKRMVNTQFKILVNIIKRGLREAEIDDHAEQNRKEGK